MSEITDVLNQLYAIEETLEITSPIRTKIKAIWPYVPPMNKVVSAMPAVVHSWTGSAEIGSAMVRESYVINVKLCIDEVKAEQASKIAAAFWPQIRYALTQNLLMGLSGWRLGGPITYSLTTFQDDPDVPTAKVNIIGLDILLPLKRDLASSNKPGAPLS